jgi:hypothetical protein
MSTSGNLRANEWTKVASGWGKFSISVRVALSQGTGQYRSYIALWPWPVASGSIPGTVSHVAYGYGSVWLWSPTGTGYVLY